MSHTTVLDTEGLLRLLRQVAGRRFLGPVDGFGCVELVFDDPDEQGRNLITVYTEAPRAGLVSLGFVMDPEDYAAANSQLGGEL